MKIHHVLLMVWVLFVLIWALNQIQASARRREAAKKRLAR